LGEKMPDRNPTSIITSKRQMIWSEQTLKQQKKQQRMKAIRAVKQQSIM
jgi:hypothetical protein